MPRPDRDNPSQQAVLRTARGGTLQVRLAGTPQSCRHDGRVFTLSDDRDQGRPVYDELLDAVLEVPDDSDAPAGGWHDRGLDPQTEPVYRRA